MAFNPFEMVRKRSKAVFAVLGIVVMLTFVLSSGGMGNVDFFTQLQNAFTGSSRSDSALMAKAFDTKLYATDLQELRRQRLAANTFMSNAVVLSYSNWAVEIDNLLQSNKVESGTKGILEGFIQRRKDASKNNAGAQSYMMYLQRGASQDQDRIVRQLSQSKEGSTDQSVLAGALEIMRFDASQRDLRNYFNTVPLNRDVEMLDFWLLLKKAEQMGIEYSTEGVKDLVGMETRRRMRPDDERSIKVQLRNNFPNIDDKWLVQALANEFKVRFALTTLRGNINSGLNSPGMSRIASGLNSNMTPYQFYEFYKDQCSEHSYVLLGLTAESFLDQVQGQPTAAERLDLFKKYGKQEPEPSRDTPGFKEPRKVRPEFVTVDAKTPKIPAAVPSLKSATQAANLLAAGMTPGGGIANLTAASFNDLAEFILPKSKYEEKIRSQLEPYMSGDAFFFRPRDNNVYQPAAIASLIGAMSTSNPLAASTAYRQTVERFHMRDITALELQGLAVGFMPHLGNALGAGSFALASAPRPMPEAFYSREIRSEIEKESIRNLFMADISRLQSKLFDLTKDTRGPKPDKTKLETAKTASRKHLDEWLTERGLKSISVKSPVGRYQIDSDPDLKPLNDKVASNKSTQDILTPNAKQTLSSFFFDLRNDMGLDINQLDPRVRQQIMPMLIPNQIFEPRWFPSQIFGDEMDKPQFLVWSTEEVAPTAYNSLEQGDKLTNGELTKRIDAAWKLQKARELLKTEAEKIAAEVKTIAAATEKDPQGVERQLKDLAEKKKLKITYINRLAKLRFEHGIRPDQMGYTPATINNEDIKYPSPDMADKLLESRKNPLGEVMVLPDNPRTTYFVSVSISREEKTVDAFREIVFSKTSQSSPTRDPFYFQYAVFQTIRESDLELMKRLRLEAKVEETEEFQKMMKKEGGESGEL